MTHKSSGFTLVELAIVLMIIGLLIGGILKGQELIGNARITSFIRQYDAYMAAKHTFHDAYGALPGDMTNSATRLPNCSATPCNLAGNGNGVIGDSGDEAQATWVHLAYANMISGVDEESIGPKTPLGGQIYIYDWNLTATIRGEGMIMGKSWYNVMDGSEDQGAQTPHQVAQIDRKMDDGKPATGNVQSSDEGDDGPGSGCLDGAGTEYGPPSSAMCNISILVP